MVETGVLFIWRGVAYRKTGLHGILFISTVDYLHGLLFIHHRPPPASTRDCSFTGSCSSSLHHALLHQLLFNQPSPWGPVQPPLHGLLFIQPSTGYCSTSPPRGPVHPVLHGFLFIQHSTGSCSSTGSIDRGPVHPAATASTTTGSCSSNPPPGTVHPNPPQCSLFIKRQQVRSASVSSSSEGIARSGSVNSHRSIAWVQ